MEILLRDVRMDERARMGVVMGTVAGCLEVDREFDRSRRENARYASPAAFSRTLPSTVLAELALYIKLTGPSVALSNGDATFAFAVWRAARWVEAFDLPCCAAVYADHLGRGLRNPYTGEAIAAAEGSCFVQMWLLSRKTGGEELRLGEVSLTRFAGGTHAIG